MSHIWLLKLPTLYKSRPILVWSITHHITLEDLKDTAYMLVCEWYFQKLNNVQCHSGFRAFFHILKGIMKETPPCVITLLDFNNTEKNVQPEVLVRMCSLCSSTSEFTFIQHLNHRCKLRFTRPRKTKMSSQLSKNTLYQFFPWK